MEKDKKNPDTDEISSDIGEKADGTSVQNEKKSQGSKKKRPRETKKLPNNTQDENVKEQKDGSAKAESDEIKNDDGAAEEKSATADLEEASKNPPENDNQIDMPSIDSLLYDSDDGVITSDGEDTGSNFEEFLADYKAKIERSLAMAKTAFQKRDENEDGGSDNTSVKADTEPSDEAVISDIGDTAAPQFTINLDIEEAFADDSDDEPKARAYDPEKPRIIDTVFDFVELFIFTLTAVLLLTTFVFKHTIVDGPSMEQTLYNGEHLIISDLFYTPKRGDIIVFADYSAGQTTPYVKRVIGLPGDEIKVEVSSDKRSVTVTVNGEVLEEEYVYINDQISYAGKECVVPEGEVFVLGDHRNASFDSAAPTFSTIKIDSILGRVLFRIYPFDKFGFVD